MKCSLVNSTVRWAVVICFLTLAAKAEAVTRTIQSGVLTNDENRPYFPPDFGFPNTAGISGTATPFVDSVSSVTGTGLEVAGTSSLPDLSDGNGIPIGVRLTYDLSFTVETTGADSTLSDGNNPGLAVSSPLEGATASQRINPDEQLLFTNIVVSNVSAIDPLGLLQPGSMTGSNALWRALRSDNININIVVTTSSDAAGTEDVTMFGAGHPQFITNNLTNGAFPPMPTVYVTTSGSGNWRVKAIGYQADLSFEPATTQPAARRTFKFADIGPAPSYDGQPTHDLTDRDTTVSIAAIGPEPGEGQQPAILDTNDTGVGVLSHTDVDELGMPLGETAARRIAGDRGEAIHFSFNRDVSLESITLGNPNHTETMVLSLVSGVNPFENLTGYSGDYFVGLDSISFTNNDPKADNPLLVPFGMNGQSEIIVAADTVLSLTSANVLQNGILLNMITANLLEIPELEGDYNGDGTVDAADYVVWRKTGGTQADYNTWRANFGTTLGSGAGASGNTTVPEPATLVLLFAGMLASYCCRRAAVL